MSEIKVPEMGESITEATILRWTKSKGDFVKADEVLVELETDKVSLEILAPSSGQLKEISKKDGETVTVHEIIGAIDESVSVPPDLKTPVSAPPVDIKSSVPIKNNINETVPPAARKILAEKNISPTEVNGSGKNSQITKEDAATAKKQTISAAVPNSARERIVPMSPLRKAIAERLLAAQHNAAILTTFNEIDMNSVMSLRTKFKDKFKETHDIGLGFMSFFTKATILALQSFPAANAEIRDNQIVYKNYYDIGIAVGGPKGLIVPVVRNADSLSFAGIEKEIARLATLVKDGKISLNDLSGGSFSITNGGIYGSMMSTPILNPPQSGILGMHNIVKRAVVINDEIVIRPMMYVALSYDHRIVDGKEAVQFLVKIKEAIEDPTRLLLDI